MTICVYNVECNVISQEHFRMVQTFPMNAWYAVAWDVDIKHALFPRTISGKHVVMYRQADGQVTALRKMPAGIAWCRFRRAGSKAIAWCVATTA